MKLIKLVFVSSIMWFGLTTLNAQEITPVVTTLAGSGSAGSANGTGAAASFSSPRGVAVDGSGNLYVADMNNQKIRKITSAGVVTTLAGSGASGSTDGTGTAASFNYPYGVAVDGSGNVYVADKNNDLIRKIFFSIATATTLNVPSHYSTIQAAIDAATAGDTVLVADGTYTENLDIDKDIKIISENGAEKTIIDGGEIKWVLGFGSSTTRACLIEGFTVTNGGNANGDSDEPAGGINVWGGSPTLKNLIIRNNKRLKYSGGGIQVTGNGNPLIADCTIKDNSVEYWHGGGITIWESSAELKNCVISNNT